MRYARPTLVTFDDAIKQPGPHAVAWEIADDTRVGIFAVGEGGAKLLASTTAAVGDREAINDRARAQGHRIGSCIAASGHVWVLDGDGVTVWARDRRVLGGTATNVWASGGPITFSAVTGVATTAGSHGGTSRGVACALGSVRSVHIVDDDETGFASHFARDLATWLAVPHHDEHGQVTNADDLRLVSRCRELAQLVERAPTTGAFEQLHQVLGGFRGHGEARFRFAANPLEAQRRFLELRVSTPSGKSSLGYWIKQGTNEQIAAFLRSHLGPRTILANIDELAADLNKQDYA